MLAAVALVSAAVLGFEVSLMRVLLVASWHHFAFVVISIVLLGFGASGTALVLIRPWAMRHGDPLLFGLVLGTAASMPVCFAVSQHVPVEAALAPALLWRQLGAWVVFWAVLTVPFLLGAAAVCLALMRAPQQVGTVYGANLLGSAAGALLASAAMSLAAPAWLPAVMAVPALAGAAALGGSRRRLVTVAGCAVLAAAWLALDRPHVRLDPYKYAAQIERLQAQGSVVRAGRLVGPRAQVEAYRGGVLHDLPFLAVGRTPPPIAVLVADGHLAGSVLEASDPQAAAVVDQMLMAFPYDLVPPQPRIALLGDVGTANVWLATRHAAASVEVVQGDGNLVRLVTEPLGVHGGAVLQQPPVRVHVAEPRHFIEQTRAIFDLVQLASMESSAAGSGGVGGLGENHLMTVSGIAACLERLGPEGLLAVSRGLQTPPRDNVKIMATVLAALQRRGVARPRTHLVVVRDYLALCTVVKASPWTPDQIEQVRAAVRQRQLTPVWFAGVRADELNQPDAFPEAPDGEGDLYGYALRRLAAGDAARFIDGWAFDIRPPTDDRPFFADFCRLATLDEMRDAYGDLWLTRTELAFLFVVATAVVIGVVGLVATVGPLYRLPAGPPGGRVITAVYFGCLGLGYLLLEMAFLSRATLVIGDPVRAAAVTISGFLLFSGLGSLVTQRLPRRRRNRALVTAVAILVVLGIALVPALRALAAPAGSLPVAGRCVVVLAVVAGPAFVMGFPMPLALARLSEGRRGGLVPWAWGVNGFASVLAPPLALIGAMTWGYHVVAGASLVLYTGAMAVFAGLPGTGDDA